MYARFSMQRPRNGYVSDEWVRPPQPRRSIFGGAETCFCLASEIDAGAEIVLHGNQHRFTGTHVHGNRAWSRLLHAVAELATPAVNLSMCGSEDDCSIAGRALRLYSTGVVDVKGRLETPRGL